MNIRKYLINQKVPQEVLRFADFSRELKQKYKCIDGYGFDFDENIKSIKLYHKIYTQKSLETTNFFRWFFEQDAFYYAFSSFFKKRKLDAFNQSLNGLNFAIKYNLKTKKTTRSVYFSTSKRKCLVINYSQGKFTTNTYYYIYNKAIINCLNKIFKLDMPKHNEAIELSFRGLFPHCTIYPKIDHKNSTLKDSFKYCQKLMPALLKPKAHVGQNQALSIHRDSSNSSFTTKGYSKNNTMQKIYFVCFDWEKSIFEN
jgi:hypothetical protein